MPLSAPLRPFLDWTVDTDPARWQPVDASILGIPTSEAYSGEPRPNDQANAPEAIRAQSGQFSDGPDHWDFDLGGPLGRHLPAGRARDAGNIAASVLPFDQQFEETIAIVRRQMGTSRFSIVLGGDHGVTIPVVMALEVIGRPVHLVQIDAHIDWRDEVRGSRRGYSSPMRRASELPWISGITQIGIRGTGSARSEEVERARAYGAAIHTAAAIHGGGLGAVLASLAGKGPFFITIDADGLDPAVMPGVMAPAPGGLRFDQVVAIVRALGREGLVGMDLVELAPSFDLANKVSAITAGRLIINALDAALGWSR
ncbi:MAG: arginase family protein [Labrys sp. (in: a-proteobacteria)]